MRRGLILLAGCALVGAAVALALTLSSSQPGRGPVLPPQALRVARVSSTPRLLARPGRTPRPHPPPAPPKSSQCQSAPPPVPEQPITHTEWLSGVTITEYYPAPERWFSARPVAAPGLPSPHAADWLYSAHGLAMEGDGVDLSGHMVHIAQLGSTGWVNAAGQPTLPVCLGKWSNGMPAWLRGGWRNAQGGVTYPLASGGWSNGVGVKQLPYGGVTFAPGSSQSLTYYHSIAVDPRLIPMGSRVYVPAYRQLGGGWFLAQDTGGAIKGRHIDVYRPPPSSPTDYGRYLTDQRILVIPPG